MKKPAKLLFNFICKSISGEATSENIETARSELSALAGCDFGMDIDRWVSWYMANFDDPDDKEVVETTYQVYKTRKRIESGRKR